MSRDITLYWVQPQVVRSATMWPTKKTAKLQSRAAKRRPPPQLHRTDTRKTRLKRAGAAVVVTVKLLPTNPTLDAMSGVAFDAQHTTRGLLVPATSATDTSVLGITIALKRRPHHV
jgi:hypothetical protein